VEGLWQSVSSRQRQLSRHEGGVAAEGKNSRAGTGSPSSRGNIKGEGS